MRFPAGFGVSWYVILDQRRTRDRVVVACADCENHEVWNSRCAASVVCPVTTISAAPWGGDFKKVGPDTTVNARCYSSNCRETR